MPKSRVSFNFTGHSVLVTGATSGIGEAVARSFVEAGADILVTGRNQERGNALATELGSGGTEVHFVAGDITDSIFCGDLVSRTVDYLGKLDIVVNSAGVIHIANAADTSDKQWHEAMNVNVNGTFYVCRAALKVMQQTGGVILNIASDAGLSASSNLCAYNASKGAVIQMSRSMARDFGQYNIRVIPVCPGDVDTPMLRGEFETRGGRVCSAGEVADLVLYAACNSARFMSGYPLVLDAANRA
jgi:NAD(P)-dependent dehydrogenase (short-subunit alcohol dehydrogenase family)